MLHRILREKVASMHYWHGTCSLQKMDELVSDVQMSLQ
jgi:hypothetical protein